MTDKPAWAYRRISTEGASPVRLVVMLYEAGLASLQRAMAAMDSGDVEKKTSELNHVLAVIGELQGSLDLPRGQEVARNLDLFYRVAREQVLKASITKSRSILEQLAEQFSALRDAWEKVDRSLTPSLSSDTSGNHVVEVSSAPCHHWSI